MDNKKVVRHDFRDHSGVYFVEGGGDGPMDPKSFATKQELNDTKKDISHQIELLQAHLDTKFETMNTKFEKINTHFSNIETQIANSRNTSIKWYIGTSIAIIGVLIALHFI